MLRAARLAEASAANAKLNELMLDALQQVQLNATGLMVEIDIPSGVLGNELAPLMSFGPGTAASAEGGARANDALVFIPITGGSLMHLDCSGVLTFP